MSRDINKFEKPEMVYQFIGACKNAGHIVLVTSVDRTYLEQNALFAQGRESLDVVNNLRKVAGLWPITEDENKKIVTWTLNSEHVVNLDDERKDNDLSRAIDFCIKDKNGKANFDVKADVNEDGISDYRECGLIGESIGFYSGIRFRKPDWGHLQLKPIKGA